MTPAEAAYYLDIPNVIMVQASDREARYGRFEPPLDQYALALRPFKRVAWSIVGSGGFTSKSEAKETLELAKRTPHITAVMLDDFFTEENQGNRARLTVDELRSIREEIQHAGMSLDIMLTYYWRTYLPLPLDDYLELIDVVTLWSVNSDLPNLEQTLMKVEQQLPQKRIMLGCYMFDYREKTPLPVSLMKLQCETGLRWLRQRRIDGIIFLANTVADFDFPSVEWTRRWIRSIGDETL